MIRVETTQRSNIKEHILLRFFLLLLVGILRQSCRFTAAALVGRFTGWLVVFCFYDRARPSRGADAKGRAGAARGLFPARRRRRSRSRIRRHRGRAGTAQVREALGPPRSRSPATPAPPARTETPRAPPCRFRWGRVPAPPRHTQRPPGPFLPPWAWLPEAPSLRGGLCRSKALGLGAHTVRQLRV